MGDRKPPKVVKGLAKDSGVVSNKEHFDALRAADQRAITIAETARAEAVVLAREIQTYKDTVHNGLLQQLNSERLGYATKTEMTELWDKVQVQLGPILEYINRQRGSGQGISRVWIVVLGASGCLISAGALFLSLVGVILFALHSSNPSLP